MNSIYGCLVESFILWPMGAQALYRYGVVYHLQFEFIIHSIGCAQNNAILVMNES